MPVLCGTDFYRRGALVFTDYEEGETAGSKICGGILDRGGEILDMKNRDRIMKIWKDQERKDRQQNEEGT